MPNFGLTQEQVNKLLLSETLGPYIAEYLQLRDINLVYENSRLTFKDLNELQKIETVIYAFGQGAKTIEKIEDPNSSEFEIEIAECEGIYGVWSDSTDWIIPFSSHQDAKQFVDVNLRK